MKIWPNPKMIAKTKHGVELYNPHLKVKGVIPYFHNAFI